MSRYTEQYPGEWNAVLRRLEGLAAARFASGVAIEDMAILRNRITELKNIIAISEARSKP